MLFEGSRSRGSARLAIRSRRRKWERSSARHELTFVANEFYLGYNGPNVIWDQKTNKHVMYLDVQAFLQAETIAAYELLARPEAVPLWHDPRFPVTELADAILAGRNDAIFAMRTAFYNAIGHPYPKELWETEDTRSKQCCDEQAIKSLAWAVFVESAMLNNRLIQDIHDTATAKSCGCIPSEGMEFFNPNPDPAACDAFNAYVMCRWPLHIFAARSDDPGTEHRRCHSRRRELQLAMALSFVKEELAAAEHDENRPQPGNRHPDDRLERDGGQFLPRR